MKVMKKDDAKSNSFYLTKETTSSGFALAQDLPQPSDLSYREFLSLQIQALQGQVVLAAGYLPEQPAGPQYQVINGNPFIVLLKSQICVFNNEWQGIPEYLTWHGIDEIKAAAPAQIDKVVVKGEGKLPKSMGLFDACFLEFTLRPIRQTKLQPAIVVAVKPFCGDEEHPIQRLHYL